MSSFQLIGLSYPTFAPLFALSDEELARRDARRVIADAKPGFPCRVSLADAEPGEELLLLPFVHQPANSPYRASGPIYVKRGAIAPALAPGEVPDYVRSRLISLRAYDCEGTIRAADVCAGNTVADEIERQFTDIRIRYIHLHNAKQGCFACAVHRV